MDGKWNNGPWFPYLAQANKGKGAHRRRRVLTQARVARALRNNRVSGASK